MTTPPTKSLALELAETLYKQSEHHFQVAQDCDMRPCDTLNWQHFKTNQEASAELRRLAAMESELAASKAEVLKLHQSLAQAVQHAEQGWSRYENANRLANGYMAELAALKEALRGLEPVAWLVYAGVCDMRPVGLPHRTKQTAEWDASVIKSVTEVRPLFTLPPNLKG